jgi:hypothetical protein
MRYSFFYRNNLRHVLLLNKHIKAL